MTGGKSKSGMPTAAKVVIGVIVTGVIGVAVCCGGVFWWASDTITYDPAKIRGQTDEIAAIEIPFGWEPVIGMELNMGFQMQMVMYCADVVQQTRTLVLMQMKMEGASEHQMEQQMQLQMRQQGLTQQIAVDSSETRTYVIDGQEREFDFAVGTNAAGRTMHQVTGVFAGRNGTAMFEFIEDEDNWDEAAVEQMIQSISTQ